MEKLEHIGIAVKNLDASNRLFAKLLGKPHYKTEEVASEGVLTSFFEIGGLKIELLQATNPESPIAKFIEKRGEGIHHLAFEVTQIQNNIADLSAQGFQFINTVAKAGADNKQIVFMHPKSSNGVLVELCEERK